MKTKQVKFSYESKKRRDDAAIKGERYYTPLEKCINGHEPIRYTKKNSCVLCAKEKCNEFRNAHKEKINQKRRKNYSKDKEKILESNKKYYYENQDKILKQKEIYRSNNKEKISISQKKYRDRYKNDPSKLLRWRMSSIVRKSLKKGKGGSSWEDLVPYSKKELERHLKKTIPDGYDWDDFVSAKLHIDHIIPVSAFNITSYDCIDFQRCWALDNLRLLPAKENLEKNAKYDEFQLSLPIE